MHGPCTQKTQIVTDLIRRPGRPSTPNRSAPSSDWTSCKRSWPEPSLDVGAVAAGKFGHELRPGGQFHHHSGGR